MSFWDEVGKAIKEGYDEQEEERAKDSASVSEKMAGGVKEGVQDLIINPVRWLGNIFIPRP